MEKEEGQELGKEEVPEQHVGSETYAEETIELPSEKEAKDFFWIVRERFLSVNQWYEIAELPMSTFKLTNYLGEEVNRPVIEGDFFRIDIPGPGNEAGDGYDWVKVEELSEKNSEDEELITLKARPAANPQNKNSDTAHFYSQEAVSLFQIKRIRNKIYAEEHGRNEVANRKTANIIDNVRNSVVGWLAKAGFSYPQWKSLMKGFIKR